MLDTLGSIRTEILGWLRGDYDQDDDKPLIAAAVNDAIEKIWTSMIQVQLSRFIGADSPVTFTLPAGAERVNLISIVDPLVGPVLGQQAGGPGLVQATSFAAYTYVTESGSETLPSPQTSLLVTANNLMTAVLPNQQNIAQAVGWNLYASSSPDTVLALQNQQPIPMGQTWVEPVGGIQDYPDSQQLVPIANSTADNISWITHMEIRTSDTLLRSWNQSSIDSMLYRQFARTLSSASEYQAYAWDLINGNRLEFRPTAGSTFTPRYFYIAKPRRLRYDQAEVPYMNVTGVHEFVVSKAIADLKLAADEYLAQQGWKTKADEAKMEVMMALNQENWSKDVRIAPHLY